MQHVIQIRTTDAAQARGSNYYTQGILKKRDTTFWAKDILAQIYCMVIGTVKVIRTTQRNRSKFNPRIKVCFV